jgi:carotenoid cleavage dioxygenase-like enzyme
VWDVVVSDSLGALSLSAAAEGKDSSSWLERPFPENYPKTKLVRHTFNRKEPSDAWALESRKELSSSCVNSPVVSPESTCREHQYMYTSVAPSLAESSPMQGLKKIDVKSGQETEV